MQAKIEAAKEAFGKLLTEQLARVEEMKKQGDFVDYKSLDQITIGVCGGDGIGPAITGQAQRIMEYLLRTSRVLPSSVVWLRTQLSRQRYWKS